MFNFDRTYWNNQGYLQAQYEEMRAAGWTFNKTSVDTFRRYYRFYNDGDATPRIQMLMRCMKWEELSENREYITYCRRHEKHVTMRISLEYRRFQRAQLSNQPAR